MAGLGGAALFKIPLIQHFAHIAEQRRAAAEHDAVFVKIQLRQAKIGKELAILNEVSDAALIVKRLARNRGVIQQLRLRIFAQKFVIFHIRNNFLTIGQLIDVAAAMHQNDCLIKIINIGVFDNGGERRQPGAGGQKIEPLAGQQIGLNQRACRLAPHQHRIPHLNMLQARGQRAILHLYRIKFEIFLIIGAGHGIGAQQRAAIHSQADHGKLAIDEAEGGVARGFEAEQPVCPMVNIQHPLLIEGGGFLFSNRGSFRHVRPSPQFQSAAFMPEKKPDFHP